MDTNALIETYNQRLIRLHKFYSITGRKFSSVIAKLQLVGWKYFSLQLMRLGLVSDSAKTVLVNQGVVFVSVLDAGNQNLYLFGILAPKEGPLAKFLIRELKSTDVFYDIGANYGVFAALASSVVTKGEIHAFEPNRSIKTHLKKTIDYIAKSQVAFLVDKALGDKAGTATFFDYRKSNDSSVSSLHQSDDESPIQADVETYTVSIISLDEYVQNHAAPTVIKVDIESAEYEFLLGGKSFLQSAAPIVTLEFKQKTEDDKIYSRKCLDYMTSLGYSAFKILDDGSTMPYPVEVLTSGYVSGVSYENVVFRKV